MPKRKPTTPAGRRVPNGMKPFDFTGTGRGPLRVPKRVTGGPAMRKPGQGITRRRRSK